MNRVDGSHDCIFSSHCDTEYADLAAIRLTAIVEDALAFGHQVPLTEFLSSASNVDHVKEWFYRPKSAARDKLLDAISVSLRASCYCLARLGLC